MQFNLSKLQSKEIIPGFHGKMIHTENMTLAYWDIKQGSRLDEHKHPQEQVVNMMEGEFELIVDGKRNILEKGDILVIPGNVPHSGKALSDCKILDVFSPVRSDYK